MTNANAFHHVHDTRKLYRRLLDSMARPGKINDIADLLRGVPETCPCSPGTYALAQTLLDQQVSFYYYSQELNADDAERAIEWTTGSRHTASDAADYWFIDTSPEIDEIDSIMQSVRIGTLTEPEKSATIALHVRKLSGADDLTLPMILRGPGINGWHLLSAEGMNIEWLRLRSERNRDYPTGCDFVLFDDDGQIAALPRTTRIERRGF
ncbi:phosphonate C-P lyase system protein PhnH [Sporolactobacillus nakayamae]|uniref:Alpha-D-ribose 1-methylphosphonate 5-triphosphate synthase subunit PhnH n=1 Tax=Sporolactobacillus nakayamae TaxID=269670 RepID=A0A1I2U2E3_9BACL|nr:phosphonate C-P lyase system protein PhnH [Sporolactobacillus nakayamae]SFG71335.1 alpha-D-ribose 1-methylphosphonate 5-triphosphate synthase subunit PhnH [Sporolactobacillus nakayamae]